MDPALVPEGHMRDEEGEELESGEELVISPARCCELRSQRSAGVTAPPEYQEVMILRHLERLKFEDIAARLNVSPGAARMLWVRAVERLRSELADDG
jgi:DNA-directed RNA polymerase specialized sigma24 family protein